jgi:hypothetical protein
MMNFTMMEVYQTAFELKLESDYLTEQEADDLFYNWWVEETTETVFEIHLNFTDPFLISQYTDQDSIKLSIINSTFLISEAGEVMTSGKTMTEYVPP